MEKLEESTQNFTCLDAINKLCQRSRRTISTITKKFTHILDQPFYDLIMTECHEAIELVYSCGIRLCVISKKKRLHDIILDTRFLVEKRFLSHKCPIFWVITAVEKQLVSETTKQKKLPSLLRAKRNGLKASLWDILQLHELEQQQQPEPQNLTELIKILEKFNLENKCHVFLHPRLFPLAPVSWYIGQTEHNIADITFYAYTKADYSLGFCFQQPQRLNSTNMLVSDPMQADTATSLSPSNTTRNRQMSSSIALTGLTLAYALGCCSANEMKILSLALSHWIGSLWVTFDSDKHVRFVTFTNKYGRIKQAEFSISPTQAARQMNEKKFKTIFEYIQKCGLEAEERKKCLLELVMSRLFPHVTADPRNPWTKCLKHLRHFIQKYKVFVFSVSDNVLHFLKSPIAGCLKQSRYKTVKVSLLANNDIAALLTKYIDFINLCNYFNHNIQAFDPWKDDHVLWEVARGWLIKPDCCPLNDTLEPWDTPHLSHNVNQLKNSSTTKRNLKKRDSRNANIILALWTALTSFCVDYFSYDLTTKPYVSLALISFQILWFQWAVASGPLAHAIENIHPYANFKLRHWCRGGFSYSRQCHVKEEQLITPLSPSCQPAEKAATVAEFDLTSAYGYSGINMAASKGFGITFGEGMIPQRRYKLFEYRAVMYTIWKWMHFDGRQIRTVFSNFSPYGLVFIGPYPIDLVAIMENGDVEMVQIDGHFCHGHYSSLKCPGLSRYANDKTRIECENQTMKRDTYIKQWMNQTKATHINYSVITDCCDDEYSTTSLSRAFQNIPALFDLIDGLDQAKGSLDNIDLNKITFIAIVTGEMAPSTLDSFPFGPVFYQQDQKDKILLTSDYYQYLKHNFNFKVKQVHWIVYYKRCWILSQIFCQLVTLRLTSSPPISSFLKSLVNYSCGFFGVNLAKRSRPNVRLSHKPPKRYNQSIHFVNYAEDYNQEPIFVVATYKKKNIQSQFLCKTPLPLFINIIEYGKMRLNYIIHVLKKHLRPTAFSILYSNIDNLILTCSKSEFEDMLQDDSPTGKKAFAEEWQTIFGPGPGRLKLEWNVEQGQQWEFVTPYRMFYAVKIAQQLETDQKVIGLKHFSTETSFNIALAILNQQKIQILVDKRVNKLVNHDTHKIMLNY